MKIGQPYVCIERTGVALVQFLVGYPGCPGQSHMFLEIEFRCLPQIGQGLGDGITLGGRSCLRVVGDVSPVRVLSQNGSECHGQNLPAGIPWCNFFSVRGLPPATDLGQAAQDGGIPSQT
jgi:hypothetical protein